jgi:acyl-CoA synthetase (NDP forming)
MARCEYVDGVIALGGVGFASERAEDFRESKLAEQYNLRELSKLFVQADIQTTEGIVELIDKYNKPIIVASETVVGARAGRNESIIKLEEEGILVYPTPDRAARVLARMVERNRYLNGIRA